jgi:hypothetical protein
LSPLVQIAALAYLGRVKDAEKVGADYQKIRGRKKSPGLKWAMQWYQFKDKADRDRLEEGLHMAGMK